MSNLFWLEPSWFGTGLTNEIFFEPSIRMGGMKFIHSSELKADLTYEVIFNDRREDALNSLTEIEMEQIHEKMILV
jgi:hypothetical protein